MERLQKWLGLRKQDSGLQILQSDSDSVTSPVSAAVSGAINRASPSTCAQQQEPPESGANYISAEFTNRTSTKTPDNSVSATVSSQEPLKFRDCMECKVIGSSVLLGSAAFVLYHLRKNKQQYTGIKRMAFTGQCVSLAAGLILMTVSVALEVGPCRRPKEGETLTLKSLLREDYEMFRDKIQSFRSPPATSD